METKEVQETVTIRLPQDLKRDAKSYAAKEGTTLREMIKELLEQKLGKASDDHKKRARQGAQ